mgnify:FL=1
MLKEQILKWTAPFIDLPVAGMDISDRTIKYLKFRSNSGIDIDIWGELAIPEGLIVGGDIKNEEGLVKVMGDWLSREGRAFGSSFVAVSIPEEKSFLRVIQIPKVKLEEVSGAIRWEIEANIPLAPEDLIYDHEVIVPLEDHLDHYDVVITAYPKVVVESYVRVLKKTGLKIFSLELESQAVVRALIANLREKKSRIIVDFGRNRTGFIIFAGGAMILTSTIGVGGSALEDNITTVLKVSREEAIRLKKEVGLNKKEKNGEVFSALLPVMAILADELKRVAEYYRNHTLHTHGATKDVDEVLLVGGDANLWGLDTYLSSILQIQVKVADPWASVRGRAKFLVPIIPKNQAIAYATVIGLAIRNFR